MKDVFIIWIAFQLIVIGMASVSIENEVFNKTYKCGQTKEYSVYLGALLPLAAFTTESKTVTKYCENQLKHIKEV